VEVRDFLAGGGELRFVVRFDRGSICLSFPWGTRSARWLSTAMDEIFRIANATHFDGLGRTSFKRTEMGSFLQRCGHKEHGSVGLHQDDFVDGCPGVARCGLPVANMVRE
jgi:hypothetical protein